MYFRFDCYFRKNPFGGEYTVFAGLEECIKFIANFKLTEDEIDFIRQSLSTSCEVNLAVNSNHHDDCKTIISISCWDTCC